MRSILAFAILLLGASSAAPEPEYSSLFNDYLHVYSSNAGAALVDIESSTGRADRLTVTAALPRPLAVEDLRPGKADLPLVLASANPDVDADIAGSAATDSNGDGGTEVSLDDLCRALFTSAQNNNLPIPFFANLLWQESRLRADDVSKKGAQGIAQFMPKVAIEKGLHDPFDPLQAIPASARFLRELRLQFGNLGFVAAAYNAGAHRVIEWLERRGSLPRETRNYVVRVTGLSVDAWRSMPVDNDALTFVQHLPCRSLPAFANVEQTQQEEAKLEEAKLDQEERDAPIVDDTAAKPNSQPQSTAGKHEPHHDRLARQEHRAQHERAHEAQRAGHERHAGKREAEHGRAAHLRHRSA